MFKLMGHGPWEKKKKAVVKGEKEIRDPYGFVVKRNFVELYHKYSPLWEREEEERAYRWEQFASEIGHSHAAGSGAHPPRGNSAKEPQEELMDGPARERFLKAIEEVVAEVRNDEIPVESRAFHQQQLTSLVQAGVPMHFRGEVWKCFLGLETKRREGLYGALIEQVFGMTLDDAKAVDSLAGARMPCMSSDDPAHGGYHSPAACRAASDGMSPTNHHPHATHKSSQIPGHTPVPRGFDRAASSDPALLDRMDSVEDGSTVSLDETSLRKNQPQHIRKIKSEGKGKSDKEKLRVRIGEGGSDGDLDNVDSTPSLLEQSIMPPSSAEAGIDWLTQIEKDLHRTFPGHPVMDRAGRNALCRILGAYSVHNSDVGYCQGMNFVAGMLLLFMDEESAFWCLAAIVEDLVPGYFSKVMIEAQVEQQTFKALVAQCFPTLDVHLTDLGVDISCVCAQWFLCLFVNALPLQTCLRMWDQMFFSMSTSVLFQVSMAIVDIYSQALMQTTDSIDAWVLLQDMAPMLYDSSRLMDVAAIAYDDLTSAHLNSLRDRHRAKIIAHARHRQNSKGPSNNDLAPQPLYVPPDSEDDSDGGPRHADNKEAKVIDNMRQSRKRIAAIVRSQLQRSGNDAFGGLSVMDQVEMAEATIEAMGDISEATATAMEIALTPWRVAGEPTIETSNQRLGSLRGRNHHGTQPGQYHHPPPLLHLNMKTLKAGGVRNFSRSLSQGSIERLSHGESTAAESEGPVHTSTSMNATMDPLGASVICGANELSLHVECPEARSAFQRAANLQSLLEEALAREEAKRDHGHGRKELNSAQGILLRSATDTTHRDATPVANSPPYIESSRGVVSSRDNLLDMKDNNASFKSNQGNMDGNSSNRLTSYSTSGLLLRTVSPEPSINGISNTFMDGSMIGSGDLPSPLDSTPSPLYVRPIPEGAPDDVGTSAPPSTTPNKRRGNAVLLRRQTVDDADMEMRVTRLRGMQEDGLVRDYELSIAEVDETALHRQSSSDMASSHLSRSQSNNSVASDADGRMWRRTGSSNSNDGGGVPVLDTDALATQQLLCIVEGLELETEAATETCNKERENISAARERNAVRRSELLSAEMKRKEADSMAADMLGRLEEIGKELIQQDSDLAMTDLRLQRLKEETEVQQSIIHALDTLLIDTMSKCEKPAPSPKKESSPRKNKKPLWMRSKR